MIELQAFFESYYRLRPVNATFTGVHEYDHLLPDWSPNGLAFALDQMRALRASLPPVPAPAAALAEVAERDRHLAAAFLDVQIAEHESGHFQRGNPSLAVGEAVFGVIALMTRPFAPVAERADAAIARLNATTAFLDGARQSLDRRIADEWRKKCLRECDGVVHLLGDGIRRWIAADGIDDTRGARLIAASEHAGAGFDAFRSWLANEAAPAPPDRDARGSDLPTMLVAPGHRVRAP